MNASAARSSDGGIAANTPRRGSRGRERWCPGQSAGQRPTRAISWPLMARERERLRGAGSLMFERSQAGRCPAGGTSR